METLILIKQESNVVDTLNMTGIKPVYVEKKAAILRKKWLKKGYSIQVVYAKA